MGILSTTAGSLPKPAALRRARWLYAEGEIERDELLQAEVRATEEAVRLQEALGLDLLVDGQMDRGDMVTFFGERLAGLEISGLVRCWGNRYYRRPVVEDDLAREEPLTLETWKAAQALTTRPVKAVLTGPYTLMDWSFDEHYRSRKDCCLAFADALRPEVDDLVSAGAREIQIDEPAISGRPEEMELVHEASRRILAGVGDRARTWIRLCYGDLQGISSRVLSLPYDGLMLGLANARLEPLERLSDLPRGLRFGAGVIDVVSPDVESVDEVKRRIESVLQRVPHDRLIVLPDAGLGGLDAATAEAKLRVLVEAAAGF